MPMTVSLVPRLTATGPSPERPSPARPHGLSPLPDTTTHLPVQQREAVRTTPEILGTYRKTHREKIKGILDPHILLPKKGIR